MSRALVALAPRQPPFTVITLCIFADLTTRLGSLPTSVLVEAKLLYLTCLSEDRRETESIAETAEGIHEIMVSTNAAPDRCEAQLGVMNIPIRRLPNMEYTPPTEEPSLKSLKIIKILSGQSTLARTTITIERSGG
jgi:hypothetical protein